MNIREIFDLSLQLGIKNDFRTEKEIKHELKRIQEKFKNLPKNKQDFFDKEKLVNPYVDSRIHYDNGISEVKKVMAGIDVGGAELLMARHLSDRGEKVDLVIGHHPQGRGLVDLGEVMRMQAEMLSRVGVPINVAESLMKVRIGEVTRGISPENHYATVDSAKLLNMNFMNIHTPADNMVAHFLQERIENKKPRYIGDIMKILLDIPEYRKAEEMGIGPMLFTGAEENRTGKVAFTEITGGTSGSSKMYERLAQAGVGTVISMHQKEEYRKEAEKAHINVVIAGHISSDSLGMNLLLDEFEKKGIEIVPMGGLIRVSRNKK